MGTYVITGANRGIGLELSRQLHERGDRVIALCRKSSEELLNLSLTTIEGIDVSTEKVIDKLKDSIQEPVDVLINNAGILFGEDLSSLNWGRMRQQFEVNTLGPLRVTTALLPRMSAGSKILIITSRMGSVADNTSGRMYGYRMSKSAVNMVGMSLAQDLRTKGISVALLHPGYVRTDMTGGNGLIEATESAKGLIARIDQLDIAKTGQFWHSNGDELLW